MNEIFAPLYEGWGLFWLGDFSNDLYSNNLYTPVGLTMLAWSILWMVIYYYVSDLRRLAKAWHWLEWILVLSGINFAVPNYGSLPQLTDLYPGQEKDVPYK